MRQRWRGILFICRVLLLMACGQAQPPDLSGAWEVSEIAFDGSVAQTYEVTLEQEGDVVTRFREGSPLPTILKGVV